jgi:hypothetical protein
MSNIDHDDCRLLSHNACMYTLIMQSNFYFRGLDRGLLFLRPISASGCVIPPSIITLCVELAEKRLTWRGWFDVPFGGSALL